MEEDTELIRLEAIRALGTKRPAELAEEEHDG